MQQKESDLFPEPSKDFMIELINTKMPFGKFEGRYVTDLPVHYLEWFARKGFPDGKMGEYIATMYEVKTNGLMGVIYPLIKKYRQSQSRSGFNQAER